MIRYYKEEFFFLQCRVSSWKSEFWATKKEGISSWKSEFRVEKATFELKKKASFCVEKAISSWIKASFEFKKSEFRSEKTSFE